MTECSDVDRNEQIRNSVREVYGKIATGGGSCCRPSASCCGAPTAQEAAKSVGYSQEELSGLPEEANMGLSCGNPTAMASLRPGEVVLDLGSGGGLDVFLAAQRIGPTGRAIGVDMTPDMVSKARRGAAAFAGKTAAQNVEFRLGEIEHLPVADDSVDVVLSNCVINLSPDKPQVWREVFRVLKPGGRVAVSDLAQLRPLPAALRESVLAHAGCIAGAATVDQTRAMIEAAGLVEVELSAKGDAINAMFEGSGPLARAVREHLPAGERPSDYVTSLQISARKPE